MDFTTVEKNLRERGFKVSAFATAKEAADYLNAQIDRSSVSFGGSVTLSQMGLFESLGAHNTIYSHWNVPDGMNADEVEALWRRGYSPREFLTPELERILNMLTSGVLGQRFDDIYASLLTNRFGTADSYMTIADFQSYADAQKKASETYLDTDRFASMMLVNTAKAGIFSSDRAVREYAGRIWNL